MSKSTMDLEAKLIERVIEQRNKLLEDAENKVRKIKRSGVEEVARIITNSEAEILSMIGSDLNATRDRIIGAAQLEGRKVLLLTRQSILVGIFDKVLERLQGVAMGGDATVDKGRVLISLITEAVTAIGGEEFIISANKADLEYLEKNLGNIRMALKKSIGDIRISVDSDPLDVVGGVVVRNSDGNKTYHNTFEGRLANVRARLESEIAEKLGVL
ncbi:MAG: V-type ATP synthase subunit E [Candidatus Bathyarchaeota archaeon]|jgi:vacuolar-type H+-ATPase subunit E/Vma4|nr:V-type ATP synthase subunit E [Candidatus Bathyarchaeota archaeon]